MREWLVQYRYHFSHTMNAFLTNICMKESEAYKLASNTAEDARFWPRVGYFKREMMSERAREWCSRTDLASRAYTSRIHVRDGMTSVDDRFRTQHIGFDLQGAYEASLSSVLDVEQFSFRDEAEDRYCTTGIPVPVPVNRWFYMHH